MKLDCSTVVKYSCGSVGTFLFIKSSHCLIENGQKVLTIEAVPQLNPTQVSSAESSFHLLAFCPSLANCDLLHKSSAEEESPAQPSLLLSH